MLQPKTFSEMLRQSVQRYHNRAITTQEILDEMIRMAKELRDAHHRVENLGLSHEELAFYDALAQNDSAIQVLGVDELKVIATELVTKVGKSVTIGWTVRESARARIRIEVRRILRQRRYPPDLQDEATKLVLEQAEALSAEWAVG